MPDTELIIRSPQNEHEWQAYYHVRWKVLRKPWGQPVGSERDELEETAYHIMAYRNNEVLGVGRLHAISDETAQIRYMAVSPKIQRSGVGREILQALEKQAYKLKHHKIILNARDSARNFYMQHGYQRVAEGHTLYGEITHTQMQKIL